jgi:hypothetical protein
MNTKNGIIVQLDGNSGDSLQATSFYLYAMPSTDGVNLNEMIHTLEVKQGIWIRGEDYPDVKDCSRDQFDPMVITLGKVAHDNSFAMEVLKDTFKVHIKRFFFYQNKDVPMLTTPGLYIRAFKAYWAYPLLLLLDVGFLGATLENLVRTNPDDVDDDNNIMRMLQSCQIMPTPLSWLERKLYTLTRKKNNGNLIKGEKSPVMGALVWKHRAESNGNPEIAEAYRLIVERYFT